MLNSELDKLQAVANLDMTRSSILSIEFPKDGKLRMRNVVRISTSRITIRYPSRTMKRMMQAESFLELTVLKILDSDPDVKAFHEQPLKIKFEINGAQKEHFPDVLVVRNGVKQIIEVKNDILSQDADFLIRTELLKRLLPNYGFEYLVISANQLQGSNELANAKYLLKFGTECSLFETIQSARSHFLKKSSVQWKDFNLAQGCVENLSLLCSLVLDGHIGFDRSKRLQPDTQVLWVGK